MRVPRSIDSSSRKLISGVKRICRRLPSSLRTYPWALCSPAMVSVLAWASPSTLTNTFAWRRSMLTSTSVTEAKPIRGSLSWCWMISPTCSLMNALIRSGRWGTFYFSFSRLPQFHLVAHNHHLCLPLDRGHDVREDLVGVPGFAADAGDRQVRMPVIVLRVDFRRGHVKLIVQPVQQALHQPALVLQAVAAREAEFHLQDADDHTTTGNTGSREYGNAERHQTHWRLFPRSPVPAFPVLCGLLPYLERFQDVTDLDVPESLQGDPALESFSHLARVVLEPPQRCNLPLVYHHAVADDPDACGPRDHAGGHVAACHHPGLGNGERLSDLGLAQGYLAALGSEQPADALGHVVDRFVDDTVGEDVHVLLLRHLPDLRLWPDVEPDDHGPAGRGQHYIGFRHVAHGRMHHRDLNFGHRQPLQR